MKKTINKIIIGIFIFISFLIIAMFMYVKITSSGEYYKSEKNLNIPIFIYHDIVENEDEVKVNYMQTTAKKFEQQIVGLMNMGYVPISYEDLIQYNNNEKAIPARSIIITFDDGFSGVYKYAFPIAKKYNIPMTSFLINFNVGSSGYYSWEEAKEMSESGLITIASHSMQHLKYEEQTPEYVLQDVQASLKEIKEKINDSEETKIFTYPYGGHTIQQQELLKENDIIQNLTDDKINTSNNLNIYGLHRMYPMSSSAWKLYLKIDYRAIKYGTV